MIHLLHHHSYQCCHFSGNYEFEPQFSPFITIFSAIPFTVIILRHPIKRNVILGYTLCNEKEILRIVNCVHQLNFHHTSDSTSFFLKLSLEFSRPCSFSRSRSARSLACRTFCKRSVASELAFTACNKHRFSLI